MKTHFTVDDVQAHIEGLSTAHVAILTYAATPGMQYGTIAGAMEISVGTVKSRLHRARVALGGLMKAAEPSAEQKAVDLARAAGIPRSKLEDDI